MKEIYVDKDPQGWVYYIDSFFAWFPIYCQGTLCWLRRVWMTWPEKDGKLILAKDVMPDEKWMGDMGEQEMYRAYYPYDPRKRK